MNYIWMKIISKQEGCLGLIYYYQKWSIVCWVDYLINWVMLIIFYICKKSKLIPGWNNAGAGFAEDAGALAEMRF